MALALLFLNLSPSVAPACNSDVPVHPILQGHDYDELAREALNRDATTIAVARFDGRLDLVFQTDSDEERQQSPVYVFDLREGWKEPPPNRLPVDGFWISCDLQLRAGSYFLIFMDGNRPLYVMDAIGAEVELAALGDIEWFYNQGGQLIRPDLVNAEGSDTDPAEDD